MYMLFSYLCILMLVTNVSLHTTDRESKIRKRMRLKMEVLRLIKSFMYKILNKFSEQ